MDMTVSTRIDLLRLFLATALVMMCVSTIAAIVGLASWPEIKRDYAMCP
jgi:hypothetical protein